MSESHACDSCDCQPAAPPRLDFDAIRARLASSTDGPQYWRSLEAAAATPEFNEWLHREFPAGASEWTDAPSRRQFLKIMAASFALAGVTACTRQPIEKIVPYVKQPEELLPGIPLFYATAMTLGGFATGLIVESHEGRPTKIEGNPDHPMSLGAASAIHQASILELYDPDRARTVQRAGETSSWEEFLADLVPVLAEQNAKGGSGLRILTQTVTSPTMAAQIDALLKQHPQAKWHQYEPWNRDAVRTRPEPLPQDEDEPGNHDAVRPPTEMSALELHYDFEKARVIVSLDSDFLSTQPASLAYARQFSRARRVATDAADPAHAEMPRLYVTEPTPSITGSMADHRLACSASGIVALAQDLIAGLAGNAGNVGQGPRADWLQKAARDLRANPGACLVIAGEGQPRAVHDRAFQLNQLLGNIGLTVSFRRCAEARVVAQTASLKELVDAMRAGEVDLLVQFGGNPVYDAPADFDFATAMGKVRCNVQIGLFYNETSQYCQWHVPQTHYLEGWGDARAFDGTVSIIQPLIEPLYQSRTVYELLDALVLKQSTRSSYDIVRAQYPEPSAPTTQAGTDTAEGHSAPPPPPANLEKYWRKIVHDGLDPSSVFPVVPAGRGGIAPPIPPLPADFSGIEIVFKPDPTVWDGRFANNGWLQELPKPLTKLTWDNAALLSPKLAARLNVQNEDVVELTFQGRTVHAPVWVMPGQAENSVTLHLGYGRTSAGHVGTGQGVNAYLLRTSDSMGFGSGLQVRKVEKAVWRLASAQPHHSLEGRDVYRTGNLDEYRQHPDFAPAESEDPGKSNDTLYPPDHTYPGYAWGMAIDLNTCIGCNACVVACQSENNIPIVGKGEVINGREMHWIRVDGYYRGDLDNPEMYHQPVPCMHCENAPCEVVCPVAATVHSPEGLNEQVYNRCVGTRYCSNNCPYKVRRFNFLQWPDNVTLQAKMQRNPDVSVRSRGVMEKCTYCVQRINEVKITSQKENRSVRDGEIVPACQQTCPTEAIVFGDINDPNSRVSRLKKQPRNFGMLADLNTRPRTTYLAHLSNPNPEV